MSNGETAAMRGQSKLQQVVVSCISYEERVPSKHPLRKLRSMVDAPLASREFEGACARAGRSSVPPQRLLGASLLRIFFVNPQGAGAGEDGGVDYGQTDRADHAHGAAAAVLGHLQPSTRGLRRWMVGRASCVTHGRSASRRRPNAPRRGPKRAAKGSPKHAKLLKKSIGGGGKERGR